VHASIYDEVLEELKKQTNDLKVDNPADESTFMGPVNDKNAFDKIKAYIEIGKEEGIFLCGGDADEKKGWFVNPTVFYDLSSKARLMQEEIFGPVLPVVTYKNTEDAIDTLNGFEKPLALYVFAGDRKTQNRFIQKVSSGSAAINDTITQVANPYLPFGGVGQSGIGRYHGKYSFDTFSHTKSFVKKGTLFDPPLVYPPYGKKKLSLIKRIFK
jgi:aldehyde dehydrogenase (NAD+)